MEYCIQLGFILQGCMELTAFNLNTWNPLHSIGMLWAMLHKIHCIQSCFLNPLHSVMLHKILAFNWVPFLHAAWNTLHSITLHGIHCILSGCIGPRCIDSTAYNRDPLHHNAWILLHLMTLHGIHCIQSGCFWPWCIKSTAFNHAAWNPLHSIGMFWAMLH